MNNDETNGSDSDVNYYDVLDVDESATGKEIDAAFKDKAKETYPGKTGSEDSSQFQLVRTAKEILLDPKTRSLYDLQLAQNRELVAVVDKRVRRSGYMSLIGSLLTFIGVVIVYFNINRGVALLNKSVGELKESTKEQGEFFRDMAREMTKSTEKLTKTITTNFESALETMERRQQKFDDALNRTHSLTTDLLKTMAETEQRMAEQANQTEAIAKTAQQITGLLDPLNEQVYFTQPISIQHSMQKTRKDISQLENSLNSRYDFRVLEDILENKHPKVPADLMEGIQGIYMEYISFQRERDKFAYQDMYDDSLSEKEMHKKATRFGKGDVVKSRSKQYEMQNRGELLRLLRKKIMLEEKIAALMPADYVVTPQKTYR